MLVVAREVPAGHVVARADLTTVSVAGPVTAVAAGHIDSVVGQTAAVDLLPNMLVQRSMLTRGSPIGAGQVKVGVAVKPGQSPADGLAAGDRVEVLQVPAKDATGPAAAPQVLTDAAVVFSAASRIRRRRAARCCRCCCRGRWRRWWRPRRRRADRAGAGAAAVIVAVAADKGAPGVTTAALTLGMVWPTDRVLLEADPSGADLPFQLHVPGGGRLAPQRSVTELANGARMGSAEPVSAYAQDTTLGVAVVPGALGPETFRGTANLWPRIAAICRGVAGHGDRGSGPGAAGSSGVAVGEVGGRHGAAGPADAGGLFRLRARVGELAASLGDPSRARSPLAVVMVCPARDHDRVRRT